MTKERKELREILETHCSNLLAKASAAKYGELLKAADQMGEIQLTDGDISYLVDVLEGMLMPETEKQGLPAEAFGPVEDFQ